MTFTNDLHVKLACMSLWCGRKPVPEGKPHRQTCKALVWAGSQIQEHKAAGLMTMSGFIRCAGWLTIRGTSLRLKPSFMTIKKCISTQQLHSGKWNNAPSLLTRWWQRLHFYQTFWFRFYCRAGSCKAKSFVSHYYFLQIVIRSHCVQTASVLLFCSPTTPWHLNVE